MNRRQFLARSSAAAAATISPAFFAQSRAGVSTEVRLREEATAPQIERDFTGLSYELAQLSDPTFFSADNRDLVAYFRLLSANGVLRLGGNTSEFCWFKPTASAPEPKLHLPSGDLDANWMPHRLFEVRPEAIDALAGFLEVTGWRLIYGLNFGNSTAQRAAEEAAYVAQTISDRLTFFQIGNEPDLYAKATNQTRPAGWSLADYVRQWAGFAEAIVARVPDARFGGPDVASSSEWITRFSSQVPAHLAPRVVALTGHYYAEGPPNDPQVTIERLLGGNPKVATDSKAIGAARASGRAYRMTEGNSCYRGGKPGMSDAFAAALWASDYMLELASLGCGGVNLHGGLSEFLTAGLGGHTPGMEVAQGPEQVHSGFYTPIQSEPGQPVRAMPVFYGMMLANQFAGAKVLRAEFDLRGVKATLYAAGKGDQAMVAVFNKDAATSIDVQIRPPFSLHSGSLWRLEAPSLESTDGVRLAGAVIGEKAHWEPQSESIKIGDGAARVSVPSASGVLAFLH